MNPIIKANELTYSRQALPGLALYRVTLLAFNLETAACVKLQVSKSKSIENFRTFFFKIIEIARYLAARIIFEL